MPRQVKWDAYCSSPPLKTTTLGPPRDAEARRPRAPLGPSSGKFNHWRWSQSFVVDDEDIKPEAEPVKIKVDPR